MQVSRFLHWQVRQNITDTTRVFETLYYQWRSGATEEQLFQSEIKSIAYLFREQGARDWWQGNMISFSLEFKTFVDSVISKTQIEETDLVVY